MALISLAPSISDWIGLLTNRRVKKMMNRLINRIWMPVTTNTWIFMPATCSSTGGEVQVDVEDRRALCCWSGWAWQVASLQAGSL